MDDKPIFSTLFDEYGEDSRQEVQEILNNFTQSWLPEKQQNINELFQSKSWDEFSENIHAVKGSAGGYGYMVLTDLVKSIETKVKSLDVDSLQPMMDEFNSICARIYAGNKS